MGLSLTNIHIHNLANLTKPQFKKALTDMMKAKGYTKATEDDASVSFSLIFTKDRKWVTVLGEDINTSDLAKFLGLQVLSVELVDSDFAELKLHTTDGAADILMLGRPYMDEYPDPTPEKWQSILGENSWSQVEEIQSGDHTFAEDALAEFAQLIGLGENILLENDDIPEGAEILHFKKAKEKKLTLNAAFKQVFGGYLEPLGYKKLKGRNTYVKLVDDVVVLYVSCKKYHDNFINPPIQTSYIQTHDQYRFMHEPNSYEEKFIQQFVVLFGAKTLYDEDPFSTGSTAGYMLNKIKKYSEIPVVDSRDIDRLDTYSYMKDNDESLTASMVYSLDLVKEFFLPYYEKIHSFEDAINFYADYIQIYYKKEWYIKYGDYRKVLEPWFERRKERKKRLYEKGLRKHKGDTIEDDLKRMQSVYDKFVDELDAICDNEAEFKELNSILDKNKESNIEILKENVNGIEI